MVVHETGAVGILKQIDDQNQKYLVEMSEGESISVPFDEAHTEGDIDRMKRVFASARKFQDREEMRRWKSILSDWEGFFPPEDRDIMHVWGPLAPIETIEDMVWFMRQLHTMEKEQHRMALPRCCVRQTAGVDELLSSKWLDSKHVANGELGEALSLLSTDGNSFSILEVQDPSTKQISESPGWREPTGAAKSDAQRLTYIAQALLDEQQPSGELSRGCLRVMRSTKSHLRRQMLSSRLRATGTCLLALFSTSLTLGCIVRLVRILAGIDERQRLAMGGQTAPEDENAEQYSDGTNSSIDTDTVRDRDDRCEESSGFWLGLLLSYWFFMLVVLPCCMLWRQYCLRRRRFCCCCCQDGCARASPEQALRMLTFERHGIDGPQREPRASTLDTSSSRTRQPEHPALSEQLLHREPRSDAQQHPELSEQPEPEAELLQPQPEPQPETDTQRELPDLEVDGQGATVTGESDVVQAEFREVATTSVENQLAEGAEM
jgi:hypothetical protein